MPDARKATALAEIEIIPQMEEAGALAFSEWRSSGVFEYQRFYALARQVFVSMVEASHKGETPTQ
jgi:hypothetical protein